jgi:dihydrofolate reductase
MRHPGSPDRRRRMRKLIVFNSVSLDGYFTDDHGDMSWAHQRDAEWGAFVSENASGGGELVFGRVTYDLMAAYWPTATALKGNPVVAQQMNNLPKIVFSRTLAKASWRNTKLIKGDIASAMTGLKQEPGPDMVIMGSGSIVSQLTDARLIDEYQVVLCPIALGSGRTMFQGVKGRLNLTLKKTRAFGNGNVVLWYEPRA